MTKKMKLQTVKDYSSTAKKHIAAAKSEISNMTKKKARLFTANKGLELSNVKSQRSVWNQS